MTVKSLMAALALLLPTSPAWATARCLTYAQPSLGWHHTICDDGTRTVHRWNQTLSHWESTITPPPGKTCSGHFNAHTQQWDGRCR